MRKVDLIVEGGRILHEGTFVDASIAVDDGRIVKIARKPGLPKADERVDAAGMYVIPGAIDVHVHVRDLSQKRSEDWRSASEAAAAGGVTTILAMPNTSPPITTLTALNEYRKLAAKKSIVDYGVFIGATGRNGGEIAQAKDACGVKVYMGSTTGELLVNSDEGLSSSFASANEAGKLACVHAEDEGRIRRRVAAVKRKGREPSPEIHSVIRDVECARLAVEKAVKCARVVGNRLHVCHVSSKAELAVISEARKGGVPVSCEVAPHHLFLSEKDYGGSSNRLKVNPPLRSRADVSTLWGALQGGFIDCVASDHAPHPASEKDDEYWEAPAGFPGLETMLPLLLDSVVKGMLELPHVVRLVGGNPARLFGIKNKGAIAEGYDADLVLVDFKGEWRVRGDGLKTKCGWSPFEGRTLRGVPHRTMVRGKTVCLDGQITANASREASFA